jgi:LPXTG-site transpeptidase (sortase) family protein
VEKVFIIEKNDWSVTLPQGYSALTLTSCHPLNSSKQRIVVRCRLDNVVDE